MLRNVWPFCVLATAFVCAQANRANPSAPRASSTAAQAGSDQQAAPPASRIAPDTPVLTIKGLCSPPGAASAGASNSACATVVTRAQFERLVEALKVDKDAQSKQQLATSYPQILVMARAAEDRGLDKQPRVQERLNFSRLQILSQELVAQIRDQASNVPEQSIEEYYRQNASQFDLVSLERIVIPNHAQAKSDEQSASQASPDEATMSKLAGALRTRAAAGEDFSKLQNEAYEAAGLSGNTEPNPHMDKLRRRGLPPAHASVFDLKSGDVSPVISDMSGHYIYKVVSKETEPLQSVKIEITNTLRRQRLENMIHQVEQPFTTDVNHAYFGTEAKADVD